MCNLMWHYFILQLVSCVSLQQRKICLRVPVLLLKDVVVSVKYQNLRSNTNSPRDQGLQVM